MANTIAGKRSIRQTILQCCTASSIALAAGQVSGQEAPPLYSNVDEFGIDMTTGQYKFSMIEGAIGSGPGSLPLNRSYIGGIWVDNWSGGAYQVSDGGVTLMRIELGSISDAFVASGGGYTSTKQDGSTLDLTENGYLYRSRDGTQIEFASTLQTSAGESNVRGNSCRPDDAPSCSIPIRRRDPNGMIYTYDWGIDEACVIPTADGGCDAAIAHYRLESVSSSAGYTMRIRYVGNIQGRGKSGPPGTWRQRAVVGFYNYAVSSSPQFSVTYSTPAVGTFQIVDGGGQAWQFISNSSGALVGVTRPDRTASNPSIGYGSNTVAVTLDGVTANYTKSGSTVSRTDPAGGTRTVVSDADLGRPTSDTLSGGGLSATRTFTYDSGGRLKTVTRPEGDRTEYDYDERGNQIAQRLVAKPSNPIGTLQSTAGFDTSCGNVATCNQPVWTRDAANRQTDYTYDAIHGGVTTVTLPAPTAGAVRPQARISYAAQGTGSDVVTMPVSVSSCRTAASCASLSDESVLQITYGSNFNVASVTRRTGDSGIVSTSRFGYDALGNRTSIDGPLPGAADTTMIRYDGARRVVGVVGPDPDGGGPRRHRALRTTYDAGGRVTSQESGSVASQTDSDWSAFNSGQQTVTTYDANGRAETQRLISGATIYSLTQMNYDGMGRVDCVVQRLNPSTYGSLPAACSLGAAGGFGADRIGRTFYDGLGRANRHESGIGTPETASDGSLTFTDNGQVASATDGNGNRTAYGYDGYDRLKRVTYPSGNVGSGASSANDYEDYDYNALGLVASRRVRDGQLISYGYDDLNRLVSVTRPGGVYWQANHAYAYDLQSNLTTASDSNGRSLGFSYDALGRKTSQSDNWYGYGNASTLYDAGGRRTRLTWGDGMFVTYEYDDAGAMTAVRENGGFVLAGYSYDDLGRRTDLARANGAPTSYAYDGASRLASITQDLAGVTWDAVTTFAYSPAGQIVSRTNSNDAYAWTGGYNSDRGYGVNSLNQYTQAGATTFGYDGRGNLTQSGSEAFGYTVDNQLATAPRASLAYDPLGRLFNENAQASVGTNTTFVYDGSNLLGEVDQSNGGLLRRYVYGAGNEPVVWYEGANVVDRRWLHADERGSIVAVSDGAGNASAINRYDEFGIPASDNQGRFQYTGQKWMPNLGMYDYKARMYSPTLGRFMQADPIGYGDGMNMYNYVGGDPVNATDPSGMLQVTSYCTGGYTYTGADGSIGVMAQHCSYSSSGGDTGSFAGQDCTPRGRGGAPVCPTTEPGMINEDLPQSEAAEIVVTAISVNQSKPPKAAQHHCYEACFPILERWQPPGSDRNQTDFNNCLKLCFSEYEKLIKRDQYTPIPENKPKPFWYPYPRPWWFWGPPTLPRSPARN